MGLKQEIIGLSKRGESLKRINRSGWALVGVDSIRPESVGEHSFGTTLIALLISKALVNQGTEVNQNTVVEMALLHDLPESIISDIPRTATELGGDLFKQAKREAERRAVEISLFFVILVHESE